MTRNQSKEAVKAELERYLSEKGIDTRRPFTCLNPAHPDRHPSMRYDRKRQKAHCFACGADYDIFDLIGAEYGLTDHKEIFAKAHALFQMNEHTHHSIHTTAQTSKKNYRAYFQACHGRIQETDYLQRRGISQEVAVRFMLGYDPAYTTGTGGVVWRALIIPTGEGSYIARNTESDADPRNRYRKQGAGGLYNTEVLRGAETPVFVVEGELDALSVATVGGEAVALGSTANVKRFLKLVEGQKPEQPLILAMDNDQAGQAAADELAAGLQVLGISFYRLNPYGDKKDANEALTADKEAFASAVESAERIEEEAKRAEREAYLQTSAGAHLQRFIGGIADSVNTPYIPTGFGKLDNVLDGGLYEGLYIVGAISSLGKTTLITQIADQIAQSGEDVVIFSLEMARNELMAKSISRHTLICLLGSGNTRHAKTTRGITTGKRYPSYSDAERGLIQYAVETYGKYADNLYISEGIGDIGAGEIREAVRKHILYTGKRPVVIVDYLQIIAPTSDRATDKQNTDKAVLELKRISRDYKVPMIGISSFNRANYRGGVTMEAYKESGAIEYSSDVLIGLQLRGAEGQDFNAAEEKRKNPREIELVVLKNRNGPTGDKIGFEYYPLFNYFREA